MNIYIYNDYFVRIDKMQNFCITSEESERVIRIESAYLYQNYANYPSNFYEIAILMARVEMTRMQRKKCNRGKNYPIIYQREFTISLQNFLMLYSIEQLISAVEQMKYNEIEKSFMQGNLKIFEEYL